MNNKKYDENEFIEDLVNPISDIMQEVQFNMLSVITQRINKIGKMSSTDAHRLSQLIRMEDLDTIESIIASGSNLSVKEIDSIIEQAAVNNDNLAEKYYKARNMPPSNFMTDLSLLNVVEQAKKSMVDGVVNLSKTTGFVFNGRATKTAEVYNNVINNAIINVNLGLFDYNTVVRQSIKQLTESGLRYIDYDTIMPNKKYYSKRLDSAVMMNIQDGIRQMNMAYRETQGSQFQADHIFVSMHGLCATDHLGINGMNYTKKKWEEVSDSLERKVGTENCRHYITYGITGISQNPYSDEERQDSIKNSQEQVEYTMLQKKEDGSYFKNKLSRYDASQVQRSKEVEIRQLKDVRNQLELNNDTVGMAEYNRKIKQKTAYYKKISSEIGLNPQMDRLRVYSPK